MLTGGAGSDTLNAGAGNDTLYGNLGGGGDGAPDKFVFNDNWGSDVVYDFDDGVDILDLTAVAGIVDVGDLTFAAVGGDAVISYGSNQIRVVNAAGLIGVSDLVL